MTIRCCLTLLFVTSLGVADGVIAQQTSLVSIADARADRNGDSVPDRLGDTLSVAGRVLAGTAELSDRQVALPIRDGTGALFLHSFEEQPSFFRGDSVQARGVLVQYKGLTGLRILEIARVAVPSIKQLPVAYDVTDPETQEANLVTLEGRVAGRVTTGPVELLALVHEGIMIYAVQMDESDRLEQVDAGDRVRITGILNQFDDAAPYTSGYQVLPRSASDVQRLGVGRGGILAILLALLLVSLSAIIGVVLMRREVRRQVAIQARAENRYQALFDRVGDAVVVAKMVEMKAVEFTLNASAIEMTGYSLERRSTIRFDELFRPSSTVRRLVYWAMQNGQAEAEVSLARADGTTTPVEVQAYLFDHIDGKHLIFIGRDISKRKAYEEGLIVARDEAEELARLQSSFVANMSHELRTPLAGIIGFADILSAEIENDEHREFAGLIATGGERLLDTLNSVLDLARFDATGFVPNVKAIDLAAKTRELLALLTSIATQKGLTLTFEAHPDPLVVLTDGAAVDRIVTNLVGNAIKFTQSGSVSVRLLGDGANVTLSVTDTGKGITPDFRRKLFEPFAQESTEMNRSHEGAGLGLSITRHLIEGLGGTITVDSVMGEGTTFTVVLPARAPKTARFK